jgi:predicted alpha/beta-fold hydrolase
LKCLGKRLEKKFQRYPLERELPPLATLKTLWEFDEKVTAPLHGFSGAAEYYAQSSSRQYLRHIQVPTLLLQAQDDPFMTPDVIPELQELSPQVKLEVTAAGGHVGFVTGRYPWCSEYWLEQRVPLFLKKHLASA